MDDPTSLWRGWFRVAREAEVDASLGVLFDDLDGDIRARKPVCDLSGRCCKFNSYGHKLYATGLEIAWMLGQLDGLAIQRLHEADLPDLDGCPFQVAKLCTVHRLRPIGCRIYFCDPNAQGWQGEVYESFLTRLRTIHEKHSVEYRYMEWRQGLAEAREVLAGQRPA